MNFRLFKKKIFVLVVFISCMFFIFQRSEGQEVQSAPEWINFIAIASSNESFPELSSWPQNEKYYSRWNWRYRPFFKLVQYWRKEKQQADSSLHLRVNGRAKYWSGGSSNKNNYIDIPGGPAFENFELREKYYSGQRFYFGLTRKSPDDLVQGIP